MSRGAVGKRVGKGEMEKGREKAGGPSTERQLARLSAVGAKRVK